MAKKTAKKKPAVVEIDEIVKEEHHHKKHEHHDHKHHKKHEHDNEADILDKRIDNLIGFFKKHFVKISILVVFLALVSLVVYLFTLIGGSVVVEGDKIKMDFVGKLENGNVFDSSEKKGPIEFVVGSGTVIPGLDEAVRGMKEGEKKTVEVSSDKAYGTYDKNKIGEYPKDKVPDVENAKVGSRLVLKNEEKGTTVIAYIKEIRDDTLVLDLNHPLTDKKLIFDIEIVSIE